MKRFVVLLLSVVCIMSSFMTATADTSHLSDGSYFVEVSTGEDGKKTATVSIEAGMLNAFDYGIIYDPAKVTLADFNWSEEFFEIKMDSEQYTVANVVNPVAIDNVGENTYIVFTGAIMYNDEGDSVNFGQNPIAYATFTDIDEGDEIAVVIGTATVNDVRNARVLGVADLYNGTELSSSYLLEGAIAEESKTVADAQQTEDDSKTLGNALKWVVISVAAICIVALIVVIIVSSGNKQTNYRNEAYYDDDEDEE